MTVLISPAMLKLEYVIIQGCRVNRLNKIEVGKSIEPKKEQYLPAYL
jgi:molybdopterin-guanine dinucleotide biosynthesis protein